MSERCPACGAAVRASADWCTLCYADLRPAPPPPEPVAAPVPVAAPIPVAVSVAATAVQGSAVGGPDPLSAPLALLDGSVVEPAATPVVQVGRWPCFGCQASNLMTDDACMSCGLPFGSGLRTATPELPGSRRSRNLIAFGAIAVLLAIFAAFMFFSTPTPPPVDVPTGDTGIQDSQPLDDIGG